MKRRKDINPTGNPLDLEDHEHCSVVLTTEAMKMKVEGKFRQRERKLFVLLVHSVWNELGTKRKYKIETQKIKRVFTEFASVKEFNSWLWDYLENLSEIKITYESKKLIGITRLFSDVRFDKEKKYVIFEIPETVEEAILCPESFARLDTYFLIGLKGKYSVSLYQILESKINLRKFNPQETPNEKDRFVKISLKDLRNCLGIGNSYKLWGHFKARVLIPAIEEINSNPLASTFTVDIEEVRGNRNKVIAIKFFLKKTPERLKIEASLQTTKKAKEAAQASLLVPPFRGTEVYDLARKIVPHGIDIYALETEWRQFSSKKNEPVKNPQGAFLQWLKKKFSQSYKESSL